ncbi:MAG: hypothetical protein L0177_08340 [Chloroflexi bacterium]|nr:hypothetical protein [Chloroflexota bacterium]
MTTPRRRRRQSDEKPPEEVEPVGESLATHLNWDVGPQPPIVFANHIFIRLQDDYFLVSFGQVELPRLLDIDEETRQRLVREGMTVQSVARLAITPYRMGQMLEQLNRLYNRWIERQEEVRKGAE